MINTRGHQNMNCKHNTQRLSLSTFEQDSSAFKCNICISCIDTIHTIQTGIMHTSSTYIPHQALQCSGFSSTQPRRHPFLVHEYQYLQSQPHYYDYSSKQLNKHHIHRRYVKYDEISNNHVLHHNSVTAYLHTYNACM